MTDNYNNENDVTKIVEDAYAHFNNNNQKADFKFTQAMVIMVKYHVYSHYVEQSTELLIKAILEAKNTNDITRYYLEQCKEKLGKFDPLKVDDNLKQLGLL